MVPLPGKKGSQIQKCKLNGTVTREKGTQLEAKFKNKTRKPYASVFSLSLPELPLHFS